MDQRIFQLPIRVLRTSRSTTSNWVCKRCLATQVDLSSNPTSISLTPSAVHDSSHGDTDDILRRALPHTVPTQYLQHSRSTHLPEAEQAIRAKITPHKKIVGVVVRAGKMHKTVTVRIPYQKWNKRIGKYFDAYTRHMVHDPASSLNEGDVIELHRLRVSSAVRHVVGSIISPFGTPIDQRPPVPTGDERLAKYKEKRFVKLERRTLRKKAAMGHEDAIKELQERGLDPGEGAEAGKGETAGVQQNAGKGRTSSKVALLGEKGQKLPKGVLPGGKHEIGRIDERAAKNKGKAIEERKKTEENFLKAKEKGEALEKEGIPTPSKAPVAKGVNTRA